MERFPFLLGDMHLNHTQEYGDLIGGVFADQL